MKSFWGCLLAAWLGLSLAFLLAPGIQIPGNLYQIIKTIALAGGLLGLFNLILAPLLKIAAFPLRWLTLGLFGLILEMAFLEIIDIIFTPEITMIGFWPIFWTGLLVWVATSIFARKKIWSND